MRLAVFLIFCISTFSIAQIQNDSIDVYSQNFESSFNEMKYDLALTSAEKLYTFAKQKNESSAQDKAKIYKAKVYYKLKMFDQSVTMVDEIVKKNYTTKEEITNFLEANNILANIHYSKYEDDKAIAKYFYIDSISEANNFVNDVQLRALQNIGLMMLRGYNPSNSKKYGKAKDYFKKSYELAKSSNSLTEMHVSGLYYGSTFVESEDPDIATALQFYDDANKYFFENMMIREFSDTYWAYASLYRKINRNDLAIKYYKEFIEKSKTFNDNNALIRAYWAYASFLYEIKNYEEAIENYNAVIEILKKEKNADYSIISNSYYYLSTIYKSRNENNLAFEALENYVTYRDSLEQKTNKQLFSDLEIKYQTEKKEQEIELLKAKNELSEKQKYIYIAIAGLLLVSGLFLFLGYRNKIKTAQKLNELNELKSRFFANISHEFRTPLTLIKSPVQQLQSNISNDEQNKQLQLIDNNANRMLELVDQLLELSKIDSGNLQIILKKGNLQHFFQSIVEPFSFKAKDENQEFTSTVENLDFETHFDKDIITKITTNLLDNAFKYNEQGKPIDFVAKKENENLIIQVRNYNNQLKEADYKKLFERFYQKDNAISGFGIGLALVKDLVEMYEGTIKTDFSNQQIHFTVELPLKKDLTNAVVINENNEVTSETSTPIEITSNAELPILLVVDDNASIREVIKDIFATNYQILEAANGKEALKLAQKEIPDCIISDVMMPEMDGFEFTNQIKSNELTSFIPVILVTAKTSEEAHLKALQNTADAFLTKPFNHEVLKATVSQQIQERKKLQERYSQELILKPTEVIINSVDEKFIAKLESVLEKAIPNSEFNAETFAEEMHISRMQLHRKLKSLFGVSATEFIRNERLKLAADLLKNEKLSVSEIAYNVGFNDVGYFSKCFKEMYHVSPSDYQKK
ncbi:MAG: response regulator [Flavobacterium sp.]|nr:response regulator [Flavobacterium sp.]